MGWIAHGAAALAAMLTAAAAAADDGCDSVCPPGRVELGRFGDGAWHAASVVHEDGGISCLVYALPADADSERGLWLFVYPTHLRFSPEQPLPRQEFLNITAGDMTLPMAVNRGMGFVPMTFPLFARAVGSAASLTVHIGVRRPVDAQEHLTWSMDGFAEAFGRIADACGFDPSPVLGED